MVYSCLGQKRRPSHPIGSTNIRSWIVTNHEETQLFLIDPSAELLLNELECLEFWFTEVNVLEIEVMSLAMVL